jgi:hypothetical protein
MRAILLVSCLLVACSDDGGSSTSSPGVGATQGSVDESCTASCAAQKKCNSSVDETTCFNRCKNESAAIGTKVRADYVLAITDCSKTASCDKLSDCDDTAKASISPTATCQSVCDDLIKKNTECRAGNTDKSKCLNDVKVFSDGTLESMRACLTKSCTEYGACVLSTMGLTL